MLNEIERFVNWIRRRNPEAHTFRDYRCDLQQFVRFVGDCPPVAITFADIDGFVAEQAAAGHTAATINRRLAAIMSLYTFLADEEPALVCAPSSYLAPTPTPAPPCARGRCPGLFGCY